VKPVNDRHDPSSPEANNFRHGDAASVVIADRVTYQRLRIVRNFIAKTTAVEIAKITNNEYDTI
jgi:hypothetical protein